MGEWLTESAAAIDHNDDDWVTAREMAGDYAELGFVYSGEPIASLNDEEKREFVTQLDAVLDLFVKGKLMSKRPKAVYTRGLRIRLIDEPSYKVSSLGLKLLKSNKHVQKSYFFVFLILFKISRLVKRHRWVIGVVTFTVFILRVAEIIQSSIAAAMIAIVVIILAAIVSKYVNAAS